MQLLKLLLVENGLLENTGQPLRLTHFAKTPAAVFVVGSAILLMLLTAYYFAFAVPHRNGFLDARWMSAGLAVAAATAFGTGYLLTHLRWHLGFWVALVGFLSGLVVFDLGITHMYAPICWPGI